jgi:hypothetical protein
MTLGTFQPRARVQGDKLNLQQYAGRPLLVRTTEFVPDFSSQAYPNPKPVVFADVVDLISGQIFINVLWGAGAVVDNLKDKAGTEEVVPVKPGNVTSPKSGRSYIALFPLESGELDAAAGWYNTNWAHVDQTRAQRQAQAAAAAPVVGNPAQQTPAPATQFQTQTGQPMQNGVPTGANPQFGGPVQGFQGQPAPQAAATQFGAPATQPPAPQGQPTFGQPAAQAPAAAVQGGFAAPQFGQPQAQAVPAYQPQAPQGFGAPQGGVFTDVPPGPPAGAQAQFAPPQGQDPAAAQAALAHLNQQQPQG